MGTREISTVAVVGAGDMGHGIAEVALLAGYHVVLRDVKQEYLDRGVKRIDESLKKLVEKGKTQKEHYDRIHKELLRTTLDLPEAVRGADLVIEAIPEILSLKKETFAVIDSAAPPHAILASNTSTMSVTQIARTTKRPTQVVGMHYFNPAVLMKTVEVIKGDDTSEETMAACEAYCKKTGKTPVRVRKDVPGFIINRMQAPSGVLVGCILDEGVCTPEELDACMRSAGMPMGPVELMDYTGLDINYHAQQYFADQVHPDYAPGRTLSEKVKADQLGKKTGKGYFDWSQGRPAIDLAKATDKVDPLDFVLVNANEATRLINLGVCSAEDVDVAILGGTGSKVGPMSVIQSMEKDEIIARLESLRRRYKKEIFAPSELIRSGKYK